MPFRSHVAALVLCFACMPVAGHCAGATPIDQVAVGAPVQITIPAEATSDEGTYGTRCLRIDLDAGQGYAFTATTPPGGDRFVALSQYRQPGSARPASSTTTIPTPGASPSSSGRRVAVAISCWCARMPGRSSCSMERIDGSLAVQRIGNGLSLADSEHDSMQASADGAEKQPGATESDVALTSQATAGEIATRLAVVSTATNLQISPEQRMQVRLRPPLPPARPRRPRLLPRPRCAQQAHHPLWPRQPLRRHRLLWERRIGRSMGAARPDGRQIL